MRDGESLAPSPRIVLCGFEAGTILLTGDLEKDVQESAGGFAPPSSLP
jgi:hypothetical protein